MDFEIKAVVLDLDGCVYTGKKPVEGAADFISLLEKRGLEYCFISNNSSDSAGTVRERLRNMGIKTNKRIVTPLAYAGQFLKRFIGGNLSVFVLGSADLKRAVSLEGHRLDEESPSVVLLGRDESFDYWKLTKAARFIKCGAKFVAANMDATHPSHLGIMPETGALAGALKTAGGSDPIAIGKPEPFLFDIAVGILNILPENILMIGDNPYTDIMGGSAAGMKTALLCLEGIPVSHQADVAFHRFSELKKIFFTKEDDSNAEQKPCGTAPSAQT